MKRFIFCLLLFSTVTLHGDTAESLLQQQCDAKLRCGKALEAKDSQGLHDALSDALTIGVEPEVVATILKRALAQSLDSPRDVRALVRACIDYFSEEDIRTLEVCTRQHHASHSGEVLASRPLHAVSRYTPGVVEKITQGVAYSSLVISVLSALFLIDMYIGGGRLRSSIAQYMR